MARFFFSNPVVVFPVRNPPTVAPFPLQIDVKQSLTPPLPSASPSHVPPPLTPPLLTVLIPLLVPTPYP